MVQFIIIIEVKYKEDSKIIKHINTNEHVLEVGIKREEIGFGFVKMMTFLKNYMKDFTMK